MDMSNDMKLTSPDGILKSGFPALEDGRCRKLYINFDRLYIYIHIILIIINLYIHDIYIYILKLYIICIYIYLSSITTSIIFLEYTWINVCFNFCWGFHEISPRCGRAAGPEPHEAGDRARACARCPKIGDGCDMLWLSVGNMGVTWGKHILIDWSG